LIPIVVPEIGVAERDNMTILVKKKKLAIPRQKSNRQKSSKKIKCGSAQTWLTFTRRELERVLLINLVQEI